MSAPTVQKLDDLLATCGADALRAMLDRAEPSPARRPTGQRDAEPSGDDPTGQREPNGSPVVPLSVGSGGSDPPAPFPVHALPRPLADYARSVAASLPCPVDYIAALMLAVLGTMIGKKRRLQVRKGWTEFALLWMVIVGRSGDRKTPAFLAATAPLRARQKVLAVRYAEEQARWKELEPKEQAKTARPRLRQVVVTDATLEALKDVLDASPSGVCYAADEVSGWLRGMGQYKAGGNDRQHWLSIYNSVQVVCNRKGSGSLVIDDPFVTLCGGVQPDVLGDLAGDGREDGLGARFLFAFPDPLPPADWTDDEPADPTGYLAACDKLWNLSPSADPVTLSPGAKAAWVSWVNAHRREDPPDPLRPFWSKCEGTALRLALVLYLARRACGETAATTLDAVSMGGAAELVAYFKAHARRVYGAANTSGDGGRLGAALRWVRKQGGVVTARLMRMNGAAGVRSALEAEELLMDLADHGHGTYTAVARGSHVFRLYPPAAPADDETGGTTSEPVGLPPPPPPVAGRPKPAARPGMYLRSKGVK